MRLDGIHHVTAVTADAQRNLDFYVGTLGLRFVKRTVNFDAPDVYHLYFGDERGSAGSVMTFFEFPDAQPGRVGNGTVHTVVWRVSSPAALEFWSQRLGGAGVTAERISADRLALRDPEGLGIELRASDAVDAPLVAAADDVPAEYALRGFDGVRAYAAERERSRGLLEALGFEHTGGETWQLLGPRRRATFAQDAGAPGPGALGAGSVHHVAWTSGDGDLDAWRRVVGEAGGRATPVIDRQYFHSVYFREPGGVLFELATPSPGFAVDEPLEALGAELRLPPQHEPLRPTLERELRPLVDPRARSVGGSRDSG